MKPSKRVIYCKGTGPPSSEDHCVAEPRWPQDAELRGTTHPVGREPAAATHQSCPENSMAVTDSLGPDTLSATVPGLGGVPGRRPGALWSAWQSRGWGRGTGPLKTAPWSRAGEAREAAAPGDSAQRRSLPREGTTNIENERAAADGRKWTGAECGAAAVGAPEAGPSPQQPGPRPGSRTRRSSGARGPLRGRNATSALERVPPQS